MTWLFRFKSFCRSIWSIFFEFNRLKIYEFVQNNPGGVFDLSETDEIGHIMYIHAKNARKANEKAEDFGIYFDGVDTGFDCECCGDRWERVTEQNCVKKSETMMENSDLLIFHH